MVVKTADGRVGKETAVRVATLAPVPHLLWESGVDPVAVLAEFDLKLGYLDDPENTIAVVTMARLLSRCSELTSRPHFGLLVGARESGSSLGAVGYLTQTAADVRTALKLLATHIGAHNVNSVVSLDEDDSHAVLAYNLLPEDIKGRNQILDGGLALMFNLMRTLCGHAWNPIEVRLSRTQPPDIRPFKKFFNAPLRFEGGDTALLFSRSWLDKSPPGADPVLHKMMLSRVEAIESHSASDLVGQLRRMLPELVKDRSASQMVAASLLGLGERTLGRRLAEAGTSFMQLREEACRDMSLELLTDTQLPVQDVSDRLGYANASSFTRAFRRWTGIGPAEWRASKRRRPIARSRARSSR